MSFADILKPRPEVLRKGGIEGVIDIENLREQNRNAIENRPKDFFNLTYPTSDIRSVISHLHHRFNESEKSAGLFLLEGYKGSGKSHLELLIYHLLNSPDEAQLWLKKHNLKCELPQNTVVLIHKFTDFPLDSIRDLVFSGLGTQDKIKTNRTPNLDDFRQALDNRHLVLIFDELERGIQSITRESYRQQSLGFLQMLSEEALRSENASVTIFASVYDSRKEPGATLKRVPRIDVKFSDPKDRQKVVLHRLFSNYLSLNKKDKEPVIRSYVNFWKRHEIEVNENYIDDFFESFPFTPEFLEQVLFRAQVSGGFQGQRGALGLLGTVVRLMYEKVDVLTTAHLNLEDSGMRNRLSDLDPSQKILQCAQNDLRDLREAPMAGQIIAGVLMATLTTGAHSPGISEQCLARQVLSPGEDINKFYGALQALVKLGTYFQFQEGNYFINEQEKPNAKIEYRSLRVPVNNALDYITKVWRDKLFQDSRTVVYRDSDQAKSELAALNKNDLRFVLAPKRLTPKERARLIYGEENRNQIILLEPKDENFNALENADIIKWAQRALAAIDLQNSAADSERKRQYERIGREDSGYIIEAIKRAGLVFVWMQPNRKNAEQMDVELESLAGAISRDQVLKQLQENIFPRQRIEEHLLDRIHEITGKTVRDVDAEYKRTLGFPVCVAFSTMLSAIKNLCRQSRIGIIHEHDQACGRYPNLTADELAFAKIVAPFEDAKSTTELIKEQLAEPKETDEKMPEIKPGWQELIAAQGENSSENIKTIKTTFTESLAKLRQETAQKLDGFPNCKIYRALFFISAQINNIDFNTLPTSLRGSLNGTGEIAIDINIKKSGVFSKAQIEQMIESLPAFANAQFQAELKVTQKDGENADD